jgi:Cytochrome C oxidase, cbb3-type, subunit III
VKGLTRLAVFAAAAGLVASAGSCRSSERRSDPIAAAIRGGRPGGPRHNRVELAGRAVFARYCATCHGETGRGDGQNASRLSPPPPDLVVLLRLWPRDRVRRVVESGSAAVGGSALCPPHGRQLPSDDIEALLAYLRVLSAPPLREPPGEATR